MPSGSDFSLPDEIVQGKLRAPLEPNSLEERLDGKPWREVLFQR